MKINKKYYVTKSHGTNPVIDTNLIDGKKKTFAESDIEYPILINILKQCRMANKGSRSVETLRDAFNRYYALLGITSGFEERYPDYCAVLVSKDEEGNIVKEVDKGMVLDAINKLIKFFSEYAFTPDYRFLNTFAFQADKREFCRNYFLLQNNANAIDIADKLNSDEFTAILNLLDEAGYEEPTDHTNKRFEVYYGAPGTGKTTLASTFSDTIIVCRSDMLPKDLLEDFMFDNGKASFHKSAFWTAMEEGKPIVLDEINMLPFETLRFLQGVLDNKEYIDYNGEKIYIADGFKVIGTMNLDIGGVAQPLPPPLVDRASSIREFTLTADMLMSALF